MYDAEACQPYVPLQGRDQFCARYVRFGIVPACSTTRIRSRLLPSCSRPPYRMRTVPKPASNRNRLETGEVQVTCCTRCGRPTVCVNASGEVVAFAPPMHETQRSCSSQNRFTLLRGVACSVSLRLAFFHVPSSVAWWVRSGSYVHLAGSPAFLL